MVPNRSLFFSIQAAPPDEVVEGLQKVFLHVFR